MIVSGGENVFPREVEDLLADHDAVDEVAVIGVDDEQFGQRLKAFVVVTRGATVDAEELKDLRQGQPGALQGPARDRVPRRAAAQRDRQGPQARARRARLMLVEHEGRSPTVDPAAWVAPTAVLCGDVRVAPRRARAVERRPGRRRRARRAGRAGDRHGARAAAWARRPPGPHRRERHRRPARAPQRRRGGRRRLHRHRCGPLPGRAHRGRGGGAHQRRGPRQLGAGRWRRGADRLDRGRRPGRDPPARPPRRLWAIQRELDFPAPCWGSSAGRPPRRRRAATPSSSGVTATTRSSGSGRPPRGRGAGRGRRAGLDGPRLRARPQPGGVRAARARERGRGHHRARARAQRARALRRAPAPARGVGRGRPDPRRLVPGAVCGVLVLRALPKSVLQIAVGVAVIGAAALRARARREAARADARRPARAAGARLRHRHAEHLGGRQRPADRACGSLIAGWGRPRSATR